MKLTKSKGLRGTVCVAPDKSISHRGIILGSISQGTTEIENFLLSEDCLSTINCFEKMGVKIQVHGNSVTIQGKGLHGLKEPKEILYTGNSGTTTRLLCGLLAAQHFSSCLDGDSSIERRPMDRVTKPLRLMGAKIQATPKQAGEKFYESAPIFIKGTHLKGITYELPVASAQLKSALILAGLYGEGQTVILEKTKSRNHTELMVNGFGGCVTYEKKPCLKEGKEYDNIIIVNTTKELFSTKIRVPGDISSAAFFMVAGLLVPNSEILIKNVGLNPTRTGIIEVLEKMGGDITIENPRQEIEPVGDIRVKTSALKGTKIGGNLIPRLIDELPILTVAASFASGTTVIGDAEELKVKESNRIDAMATELKKAGVDVEPTEDGLIINGTINKNKNDKGANDTELEGLNLVKGAKFHTYNDHRIAMSLAVLALMAEGSSEIVNHECVNVSYPDFFDNLSKLNKEVF